MVMFLFVAFGCKKGGSQDTVIVIKHHKGQPLAQIGKSTLTIEEMRNDFLDRQGQFRGAPNLNTEKARSDYVETQVMQEAMFLDAVEQNYFDRPDVKRDIKKIVVQKLMRDKLDKAQAEFVPTNEQIEEHYKKNPNFYNRDEAVKVAYISIPFGSDKVKTKELAMVIQKDAVETVKNAQDKAFSRLALKHASKAMETSKAPVETNETDYLDKLAFENKFGKNSFDSIKNIQTIGQISPLVTTDNAFVIMMKTGYRKALNESLEDARPKIVKRLSYESRGEFYKRYMDELRKKYNVKVFTEHFAELSKGATDNLAKRGNTTTTTTKEGPLDEVKVDPKDKSEKAESH
jgi:hypothetical protein